MKHLLVLCLALLFSSPFGAQAQWVTDYWVALKKAQAEDKAILVNFTGSDWCGWCVKFKNEVFSQPEFISFAEQNLVLLEVDFPRKKSLSFAHLEANRRLADRFEVEGYPTIVILNKGGVKIDKHGYTRGGPKTYIAKIRQTRGFVDKGDGPLAQADPPPAPAAVEVKKNEPPAYTIPPPVIHYGELALKGISGGRLKMALINNKSLAAGEKAMVKAGDKSVEVLVKEIREDSVLVQIEGEPEPRELKLNAKGVTKTE